MIVRSQLALFVLVTALATLAPPPAHVEAQSDVASTSGSSWSLDGLAAPAIAIVSVVGAAELALVVADIYSWAAGTPFDDGWAAVDLVVGALWVVGGAATLAYFVDAQVADVFPMISGGVLALGALHIAHGAWSLATNDPPPPVAPGVALSAGGAHFTLAGSF